MLQWCMFGGYEGHLGPESKAYFTMFGGCELHRPTLARELLAMRAAGAAEPGPPGGGATPTLIRPHVGRKIIITIFGGTEIKCPTLAEEFLDLREAIRGNAVDINRWDSYMAELDRWRQSTVVSFTLFGSFEETALPAEDEEVESLALQRHLGNIDDDSGRLLEMGVGQAGSQRRAVIHQAVLTA